MRPSHRVLDPSAGATIAKNICALAVMTKAPRAGQVKTRLVPPLSPEEAAQLNICFLHDTAAAVSADVYAKAVEFLSNPGDRVVLGPSDDGGYYLIGMKQDHRQLFERIEWSTERVLEQTKQRARELNLEVSLLPTGYDVDDAATLRRLCDELLSSESTPDVALNTRKFLAVLMTQKKL